MNRRVFLGGLLATVSVPALMVPQPQAPEWAPATRTFDYDPAYHPAFRVADLMTERHRWWLVEPPPLTQLDEPPTYIFASHGL